MWEHVPASHAPAPFYDGGMMKALKLYCANCDDVMEHKPCKTTRKNILTTYRCMICETTRPRHMSSELTQWEIRKELERTAPPKRGRPEALTPEQKAEAERIRHAVSDKAIAIRMGCTPQTISRALGPRRKK